MLTRLLLVLAFLAIGTSSARAAELCNQTSFIVHAAAGWPVEGGVALQGWTRLRPGACTEIAEELDMEGDQPLFIYAKTSDAYEGGVREWRGSVPLCVDEADFDLVANTRCAALGLASRDFMIREGDDRQRTVLVEPDNYRLAPQSGGRYLTSQRYADIAAIQRLLAAAGGSPSRVDGMEGSGTRRAIRNYLREAGVEDRPDNPELIDFLESEAMARNASAGLTICNDSSTDIAAAIGQQLDGRWQSRGWWRLHNGECARVLASRLESSEVFYYAERINADSRTAITGGDQNFCHAPSRYLAEDRTDCAVRGYAVARFRRIPQPEDGGSRVTISDGDFEGIRP